MHNCGAAWWRAGGQLHLWGMIASSRKLSSGFPLDSQNSKSRFWKTFSLFFLIWRWTVLQEKMWKSVKTVWIQMARTSKFYVVRMMCADKTEGQALKGWSLEVLLACKLTGYTTTASVDILSKNTALMPTFQDKLDCCAFWTIGRHRTSSMESFSQ